VGAIANEAGISSEHIGRINIYDDSSTVDLPEGMPKKTLSLLMKTWVCNTQLNMFKEGKPETQEFPGTQTKSNTEKNRSIKQEAKKKHFKHKKNKQKKMAKAQKTHRQTAA
jgi:ATP-dependent RNA helicase DeaD